MTDSFFGFNHVEANENMVGAGGDGVTHPSARRMWTLLNYEKECKATKETPHRAVVDFVATHRAELERATRHIFTQEIFESIKNGSWLSYGALPHKPDTEIWQRAAREAEKVFESSMKGSRHPFEASTSR